jgi:hypothetical protein
MGYMIEFSIYNKFFKPLGLPSGHVKSRVKEATKPN